MAESQNYTAPDTSPTSPLANSLAGSAEQTSPTHDTQEESSHTIITKDTTLSNSMIFMLKDQAGTAGSTASSSVVTSAETPKQNQRDITAGVAGPL